ncbi:MAG: AsnC family transcriptional regulator [Deltaproteobacteria bacterium]|nr:AsnC family transcriptional regulator [Deltaproteobacteria bacterium]MBW2069170.1 AsnC family transcriptional regulator [Deltaproteobacteria bacterium]
MDRTDRLLLNLIQKSFPVTVRPFEVLGARLHISEGEVMQRIERLKKNGIVRQISAIFNTGALGYESSLVAMAVPEGEIERAAMEINRYPGVSHNYLRPCKYNIWFTIAVPPGENLKSLVAKLASRAGGWPFLILPAIKKFKLAVVLDVLEDEGDTVKEGTIGDNALNPSRSTHSFPLTKKNIKIVRHLQEDLPLTRFPFRFLAEKLAMTEESLISTLTNWIQLGWIRRFAAVLNHRQAGFVANGMVVWLCPEDRIDEAGMKLAAHAEVSHCYFRPSHPEWPYNLYAMIHGRNFDECRKFAKKLAEKIEIPEHKVLFSTKEFKKIRLKLFWEEEE